MRVGLEYECECECECEWECEWECECERADFFCPPLPLPAPHPTHDTCYTVVPSLLIATQEAFLELNAGRLLGARLARLAAGPDVGGSAGPAPTATTCCCVPIRPPNSGQSWSLRHILKWRWWTPHITEKRHRKSCFFDVLNSV